MEAECLAFVAEVTGPLVHWVTGPLFGLSSAVLVFVACLGWKAATIQNLRNQVSRWEIVADRKGWHYNIIPLKATEIETKT